MKIRMLPAFLKGGALQWHKRNASKFTSWISVKRELIEFFSPPQFKRLIREKLRRRDQLCMQIDADMTDEEMGQFFLDGLLQEIKNRLVLGEESSFTVLQSQAQLVEQSLNKEQVNLVEKKNKQSSEEEINLSMEIQ